MIKKLRSRASSLKDRLIERLLYGKMISFVFKLKVFLKSEPKTDFTVTLGKHLA